MATSESSRTSSLSCPLPVLSQPFLCVYVTHQESEPSRTADGVQELLISYTGRGVTGASNVNPLASGCSSSPVSPLAGAGLGQSLPCRHVWAPDDGLLPLIVRVPCSLDGLQTPTQPLVQPTKHLPGCQTSDAGATLGNKRASAAAEPKEGRGRQAGARAGTY